LNSGKFITASTKGLSDTRVNHCGITNHHAYSVLDVFEMSEGSKTYKMLLIRNPRQETSYHGKWNPKDHYSWNEELIN
jgi:hypothetical protein